MISWKTGSAYEEQTTRCPRCGGGRRGRYALSRGTRYAVLADRFPANNWKCKRNRPPCDSSIIESLISVWMRSLSRSRAPFARIPAPVFPYARTRGESSFFRASVIVNPPSPLLQSLRLSPLVLVIYMPERLAKTHHQRTSRCNCRCIRVAKADAHISVPLWANPQIFSFVRRFVVSFF